MAAYFYILRRLTFLVMAALLLPCCRKESLDCGGNCTDVTVRGSVVNKISGGAAPAVPVKLSWSNPAILKEELFIAEVKAGPNGDFLLTTPIDTAYFSRGYALTLSVGSSSDFVSLNYSGLTRVRSSVYSREMFTGTRFEVYKAAPLRLKLRRESTERFQLFSILHSNTDPDLYVYDYNVDRPTEEDLNLQTVADMYTRIRVKKTLSNGRTNITLDSIKCRSGVLNVFQIDF